MDQQSYCGPTGCLAWGEKPSARRYWDSRTRPVGQIRTIGNTETVIIREEKAICAVDLSIRDLPITRGTRYTYVDSMQVEFGWLPQGTEVRVIARSTAAEVIDGLDAYWYFVLLQDYLDASPYLKEKPKLNGGWMFGGYLDFEGK